MVTISSHVRSDIPGNVFAELPSSCQISILSIHLLCWIYIFKKIIKRQCIHIYNSKLDICVSPLFWIPFESQFSQQTYSSQRIEMEPEEKNTWSTFNKGIGDAGSTADFRMLWSAMVCLVYWFFIFLLFVCLVCLVCLFVCLFVCLCVCLFIYLFVFLF